MIKENGGGGFYGCVYTEKDLVSEVVLCSWKLYKKKKLNRVFFFQKEKSSIFMENNIKEIGEIQIPMWGL